MRKLYLLSTLVLALLFGSNTHAQEFSNKGKEFWLAYCYHVGMTAGGPPAMTLYLTSDVTTTYTVEIYGVTTLSTGTINANQVIPVVIPNAYFANTNGLIQNRTIHVTALKPIVVYSFITRSQASAASLCFPTNVLGREYMTSSFTQISNENLSNSYITIIAVEDNTTVEITPTGTTVAGWLAGVTQTITLNKGEIYQVLGTVNPTGPPWTGVDLSGTVVRSIAGTGGCKKIAVFSGSGKMNIGCSNGSADNLYQQCYPISSWGQKYLTVPAYNKPNNFYRIYRSTPVANVYLNGGLIPAGSFTNEYYTFLSSAPSLIEADKPISVSQYFTSQNCQGNSSPFDPDMIILSPVEQNIDNVTLVNSPLTIGGGQHHLHVVMRNSGTGQSSFLFDGNPVPVGNWTVHPGDGNYSYLYLPNVAQGNHTLASDSGFNALAYGYGNAETYGYSAGANIKNLYQQTGVVSQYGIEPTAAICVNSPFKFKVSMPYCVDSLRWDLSNLPGPPPQPATVIYTNCIAGAPGGPDSITVVNGVNVYWYSLPTTYNISPAGVYPVTITTYSQVVSVCGSEQDIDFDLTVYDPPIPDFTFTAAECPAVAIQFTDATTTPRPSYQWSWNFGDPGSGPANTSTQQNPTHTFSGPGLYTVTFSTITTPGCVSGNVTHQVNIPALPSATISAPTNVCVNSVANVTFTGSNGAAPYTYYYTVTPGGPASVNGGASVNVLVNTATAQTYTYTLDSIRNQGSTVCVASITGQSVTVNVVGDATATLTSAPGTNTQTVCVNTAITNITYSIGGSGTGASISAGALPAGVSGAFSGGTYTISGTPTATGTFNFTISTTGPCGNASQNATITVNPDHAVNLTSGNSTQTVCVNTAIASITYTLGGGATGGTVTGLPAGVTGSVAGTTLTISGTPTASGTFNYTLNTTGNACIPASVTGTLTVNPAHAVNLTSGNANQAACVNIAITNITYTLSGGAAGATVTGLPPGVTGSVAGTTLTISGTPTAGGTFNYTVNTTGNACTAATSTGTITVNPDHAINLTSGNSNQTVCINTAIATISYTLSGGATGGTVTGLPAGVTGSVAGTTLTINGTPTATGTFNYTVNTSGNSCLQASATGTITVNPAHAVNLTSGNASQAVCINTAIAPITYTLSGGSTGGTVTGLPAGVTGSVAGTTLTISGTPTAAGIFNFTVNTTGNACAAATANGTLTVNPDHAINLTSGNATQTVCINTSLVPITYTLSGGATGGTVTGLPAGVTSSVSGTTLTISGTPTAFGTFNYTITTTGNGCLTTTSNGTITVSSAHAVNLTSGNANQAACVNVAITNITYTLGGGATGATVTGLPGGVTSSVSGTTLTISGTPTATGTFNFTINTTGNSCAAAASNGTITVNPDHALNLTSGNSSQTVCVNTAIASISYTLSGGATGGTITGLPAGVTGSVAGTTLTISGTPTATGTFNYTVNTTGNSCQQATASGTITVNPAHAVNLTSGNASQTVCVNTAIASITYTLSGGSTGGNVTGLPAGITGSVAGTTLTISGTPTAAGTFNFTVNTTGNACAVATATGTITVNPDHAINLTSGNSSQTVCVNTAIASISYTLSGGATGATVTGLPAGVTSSVAGSTLTISGSPATTAGSPFSYTITTTGNSCVTASANGTITVNPVHAMSLTSGSANQTVCVNVAIGSISYTLSGGATGATVTGLPAGVAGSVAGTTLTISGTPTAAGTFNFTVNTTGNACAAATANGTITVNPDHAINLTSANSSQNVCINTAIAPITYTLSGGATGATVTGLPAGVTSSVAGSTLTISGTPTASGTFNYSINTTGNSCVVATATGTITVTPAQAVNLVTGNATQTVCINTAIGTITYTLSGGATGATVTGLPAGVNSSLAGNTLTISGTPSTTAGSPFNFTITTSGNSCTPSTSNGTITVQADHSLTRTSAASTTDQTVCTDRPMTPITYTIGGGATGATVTGLPPGVTSSVTGNVLTISGTPTTIAGSPFNYSVNTTGNTCVPASGNGRITVLQTPAIQFDAVPGVCADEPAFQLTALPGSGTFSGTGVNGTGLFTPGTAGGGDHVITYTYTAANGCTNTKQQIVAVYPLPVVDAGPDRGIIEGGQITLNPVITANFPVTYLWTPSQYLNNPNIANPIVSGIPDDRTYTLTVTSDKGCSASDIVLVKLLRKIEIPNIFSPNKDGIHDTWMIQYLDSYPGCTVEIFNRYGQRIYQSEGYAKPWDGTVNGKPVPVGTYYYIINPKNGRSQMSGYVDVIR